jgi:NADH:ubiquinone oxidoreductase subunit E
VEELRNLIEDNNLEDKVEIAGTFCLGQCQKGVCVTIGDDFYSVSPDTVDEFFKNEIQTKL